MFTLAVSGTALAAPRGAQKAAIYGPEVEATGNSCAGGAAPTASAFGSVALDTPGNETAVTGKLAIRGASPSAAFQVTFVEKEPTALECRSFFVGTVKTTKRGTAKFRFTAARAALGPTRFWVTLAEESPFTELLASSSVELD
jgi:hypothetical protein